MHPANNFQLPTIFRLGSGGQHPTNSVEALKGNCTKKISKKLNGVKKRKTGRAEIVQCHDSASCGGYAIQLGECCGQHTLYLVITTHTHTRSVSPLPFEIQTTPATTARRDRPEPSAAAFWYTPISRHDLREVTTLSGRGATGSRRRRCAFLRHVRTQVRPGRREGEGGEQTLNESGRVRLFNDAL